MILSSLEKYKLACFAYNRSAVVKWRDEHGSAKHSHHIRPKSIWPELADESSNIVDVPPAVHAVLHKWLHEAMLEANDPNADKMRTCSRSIVEYIFEKDGIFIMRMDELEKDFLNDLLLAVCNGIADDSVHTKFGAKFHFTVEDLLDEERLAIRTKQTACAPNMKRFISLEDADEWKSLLSQEAAAAASLWKYSYSSAVLKYADYLGMQGIQCIIDKVKTLDTARHLALH